MTRKEQVSVEELLKRIDAVTIGMREAKKTMQQYVEEDKKWKREFELKLKPLVEERAEKIVLLNAGQYAWKGLVAVVAFLGAIGVLIHYGPDMLKAFFGK